MAPLWLRPRSWPTLAVRLVLAVVAITVLYESTLATALVDRLVHPTPTIAAGGSGGLGVASRPNVTAGIDPSSRPSRATPQAMNILVMGIDSRTGMTVAEQNRYHLGTVGADGSDTIMLVHLYADGQHATIINFPRDLYVQIPAWHRSDGKDLAAVKMKLNAAYARGDNGGLASDGPNLAIDTLETLTGIHIDHFMSINIPRLGALVTALGGVDVCLPQAVNDKESGLDLPKGVSHLDDVQAVAYVRDRYTDTGDGPGDFGRIRRQQKFLSAMLKKVMSAGTLTNTGKLQQFVGVLSDSLTMDSALDGKTLLTVASSLQGLSTSKVTFTTVPIANDNYVVPGVGDTVLMDATAAKRLFEAINADKPIPTATATTAPSTAAGSGVPSATASASADPNNKTHTAADDPCAKSNG
jgi:LCP family protein required for cell wall assembly